MTRGDRVAAPVHSARARMIGEVAGKLSKAVRDAAEGDVETGSDQIKDLARLRWPALVARSSRHGFCDGADVIAASAMDRYDNEESER